MTTPRPAVAAIVLVPLLLSGCGDAALQSHWRDRAIDIDGDHADWEGRMTFVEDAKASIGFQNDGEFMYVAIATADRTARMQIMRGMAIWFDPTLDKARVIRCPFSSRGCRPSGDARNHAKRR